MKISQTATKIPLWIYKERETQEDKLESNMKKNKKFQKEQLAEQGYTDITECYRDSVDNL